MFMTDEKFYFKTVTEDIVRKEIMTLDGSKTTPNGVILINTLKINCQYSPSIYNNHHKFFNWRRSVSG